MSKVVLGFDFGMKYIGVAVGQTITNSAKPLTSFLAKDGVPNWKEIDQFVKDWNPNELIVGLPLHMDGSMQPITFAAQKFANRLRERYTKLEVHEVDERLSTWEAKNRAPETTKKKSRENYNKLNATAAAVLVEQWLQENLK